MLDPKIPVYFMPGMAANSSIFKKIKLPNEIFSCYFLEWFIPEAGMSLAAYATELLEQIKHKNPILIGVSFGGMVVQEMAKQINTSKIIVISSVKLRKELPKRMLVASYTKVHKFLPTGLVNNVEAMAKLALGERVKKRIDLYQEYLSIRDKDYINWSLNQIVNWSATSYPENLVHIHGDKDSVFPISRIQNCIVVKNGTHAMIIYRARWFNEHLPDIILK